jgi:hypothetical protein
MSPQQAALENLRIIRSLLEKAHIYRAVSAQAALFGGFCALVFAWRGLAPFWQKSSLVGERDFLADWLGLLFGVVVFNSLTLYYEARKRGQPFVSPGMRTALRALLPPLLTGGVLGIGLVIYLQSHVLAALIWVMCYGLALLATAGFAPRSLVRLGWAFVLMGWVLFGAWAAMDDIRLLPDDLPPASLCMGLTFGLLHVIYGIAVLASKKPEPLTAE